MISLLSILFLAMILVFLIVVGLFGRVRRNGEIRPVDWVILVVPLVVIYGCVYVFTMVFMGLGHYHPISQAWFFLVMVFLVIVVGPVAGLAIYRDRMQPRPSGVSSPPRPLGEPDAREFDRRLKTIRNIAFVAGGTLALFAVVLLGKLGLWPPLAFAVKHTHHELTRFLLDRGIDPNQSDAGGLTPLVHAVIRRDLPMISLLLERGADVNGGAGRGAYGQTPLLYAIYGNQIEIVRFLLDKGANPNPPAGGPLLLIAAGRNIRMVELLLERGADVNARSPQGTPLVQASDQNLKDLVEILLARGPDLNATDAVGFTALMKAARQGHIDIVHMLVEKGADLNVQNSQGHTALFLAEQNRHKAVAEFLRSHGAKQ